MKRLFTLLTAVCLVGAAVGVTSCSRKAPHSNPDPYFSRIEQQRPALEQRLSAAADDKELIAEAAPALASRDYNIAHYAYTKLIEQCQEGDLQHLVSAYNDADSLEVRIWLASVSDYCGSSELLHRLKDEAHQHLEGEGRQRAAIAVAFKLGDPSMVPYLIEALDSDFQLWDEGMVTQAAPSAAYLLTRLTNHFARGNHPSHLLNFSCFVMPPPVAPYPVPTGWGLRPNKQQDLRLRWEQWWEENRDRSQTDWIRDGLERDVETFLSSPKTKDENLITRLRWFLDVDVRFAEKPRRKVTKAWAAAKQAYTLPPRLTK
jgi:HEAT repeat protein